jgi:cytoskeleton protein RodZ
MFAQDWSDMGTGVVELDVKPLSLAGVRGLGDVVSTRLEQVEAQLQTNDVYCRAVDCLQQLAAERGADIQLLLRTIAREAIRLTLQVTEEQTADEADEATVIQTAVVACTMAQADLSDASDASMNLGELDNAQLEADLNTQLEADLNAQLEADLNQVIGSDKKLNPLQTLLLKCQGKGTIEAAETEPTPPTREECLVALGEAVMAARGEKGMTLAQLHARTFVPLYHLQALEQGEVDRLPQDVYLKGFLRRIENALVLESGTLAAYLPDEEALEAGILPSWVQHKGTGVKATTKNLGGLEVNSAHLYLAYTAIMAGGVCWISGQSAPKNNLAPIQIDEFRPNHAPAQVKADNLRLPKSTAVQTTQKGTKNQQAAAKAKTPIKVSVAPPEALR